LKRFIALCIAMTVALTFCGCKTANAPVSSSEQTMSATVEPEPTQPPQTEPQYFAQLPMYAISLMSSVQEEKADDLIIFRNQHQNISLVLPDQDIADKVILDFLNRTQMDDASQSISATAQQAYSNGNHNALPYSISVNYAPMRIDAGVLSLLGSVVTYTGGAHGNEDARSVTYDLLTGDPLSWDNILQENVTSENICNLVLDALLDSNTTLFEGYEQTVKEQFSKGLSANSDWYLSNQGLCYYFSPYAISPYSSGTVSACIPYHKLTGILKDAYFPGEQDLSTGSIHILPFKEATLADFTQITEVSLAKEADMHVLYTDGSIRNVQLVLHSADSSELFRTIFAASSLTPGDAIVIQTNDLQNLSIQYTSGETEFSQFLN